MPGSIIQNIQKMFFLREEQARKYACVVFLACLRFETSKRKLQYMNFASFKKCTEIIMDNWTYPYQSNKHMCIIFLCYKIITFSCIGSSEYFDTEMDKEFLTDLRDLRILSDKEKEHKQYVVLTYNFVYFKKIILVLSACH